ncbi:MAG: hypothetical protein MJ197_08695 [Bacteroidales bacterium]|nr:hypothetical protein [Bacteroidales bacterium]
MTNQEIIEQCTCGLSEDINGEFYQLYDAKKICELKDEQYKINWKKVAKKWYSKAKKSDECLNNRIDYTKTLNFELNKRDLEIAKLNDEISILKRKLAKYGEI